MCESKLPLLVTVGFVAVLAMAQTAPPTLPPRTLPRISSLPLANAPTGQTEIRTFHIGEKEYRSVLTLAEDKPGSAWDPATPLPVGLARAEAIARLELAKLVGDPSGWHVSDFHIGHFANKSSWYICVTLEPAMQVVAEALPPDSFTALLDFHGTVGRTLRVVSRKQP